MFELQCQVQAPASVASRLDLLWFFTNTSGDTVDITSDTFSSLDTKRVTHNKTSGDSLLLTSEISFRRFVFPTHAGNYFCRVSVSGAAALFSQSNSQTYDIDSLTPCNIYTNSFTQSFMRCAGNISFISTLKGNYFTSHHMITLSSAPSIPLVTSIVTSLSPSTSANFYTTASPSASQPLLMWIYILVGVILVLGTTTVILGILFCFKTYARSREDATTTESQLKIVDS